MECWGNSYNFAAGDPYFANVSLLLRGDGANGSTAIIDSSPRPKTVTISGDVRISTAQSKFGGSSLIAGSSPFFTWGSNCLQVPAGSDFAYGTGDFTVETWVYLPSNYNPDAGNGIFFAQTTSGTNYFVCGVNPSRRPLFIFGSGGGTQVLGPVIPLTTWVYVAVVRSNNVATVYADGVAGAPVSCTFNFTDTTYLPTIGRYSHSIQCIFAGFIDDLRVTKNMARNVTTPPTAPFPDF